MGERVRPHYSSRSGIARRPGHAVLPPAAPLPELAEGQVRCGCGQAVDRRARSLTRIKAHKTLEGRRCAQTHIPVVVHLDELPAVDFGHKGNPGGNPWSGRPDQVRR